MIISKCSCPNDMLIEARVMRHLYGVGAWGYPSTTSIGDVYSFGNVTVASENPPVKKGYKLFCVDRVRSSGVHKLYTTSLYKLWGTDREDINGPKRPLRCFNRNKKIRYLYAKAKS